MGWRYLYFTAGALVFLMSIARILVIRFHETPKFLLCQGRDEDVVHGFQRLAQRYNRSCSITVDQIRACGEIRSAHSASKHMASPAELFVHIRGLFTTRKLALSTALVWFSWSLIGMAYSLYYVFLPDYLASRQAATGDTSAYITWRNYAITNICAIPGPILAGFMCENRFLGRKYTMTVGAVLSSKGVPTKIWFQLTRAVVFFFAYTAVRTDGQNLGFACAISVTINIYYGTLYAYTVEVMPSAHRGTGNGIAVAMNRLMGIMSAVVGTYASTSSSVPIYVCAAMLGVAGVVAACFPFESRGKRSV
jgi:hypothetical protein